MPTRPPRACARCGRASTADTCPYCPARSTLPATVAYDDHRGSARERGYSTQWEKYALDFRARFPFCGQRADGNFYTEHSTCARLDRRTLARLVDHIRPLADDGDMWAPENHQSLCYRCHALKTKAETKNNFAISKTEITVVCGPTGSGKTTYVEERRRPGDLVWDLDAVADTLCQLPHFPRPPAVVDCLIAVRAGFLAWLRAHPSSRAFVIVADPAEAAAVAASCHARVVELTARVESRA